MSTEPQAGSTPHVKTSNELAEERTALADDRTRLALKRTIVALDRTLMAWVRTATSLISFGFTIYKFFQEVQRAQTDVHRLVTPRDVGMIMIALGVGGLALALKQYHDDLRALEAEYPQYGPFRRSLTSALGTIVAGLGLLGFVVVVLRQ